LFKRYVTVIVWWRWHRRQYWRQQCMSHKNRAVQMDCDSLHTTAALEPLNYNSNKYPASPSFFPIVYQLLSSNNESFQVKFVPIWITQLTIHSRVCHFMELFNRTTACPLKLICIEHPPHFSYRKSLYSHVQHYIVFCMLIFAALHFSMKSWRHESVWRWNRMEIVFLDLQF
jgi:hypothetical protein